MTSLPCFFIRFFGLSVLFFLLSVFASAVPEAPYFSVRGAPPGVDALPLKSTDVTANLGLGFVEVRVVQTYRNEGAVELEADYLFPAGVGAAVHGLTMTVGDRRIEAVVKEKEEARRTFAAAKQEGKTAVLLEARRPNVFSARLTRIRPGETVAVELRYTERLRPEEGEFSWAFPTTIGPRYSTAPDALQPTLASPDAGSFVEPVFSLRCDLRPGFAITKLESPSHRIQKTTTVDGATVEIVPGSEVAMNRDFILRYRLQGETTAPRLLVQEWKGDTYVAVNWMPPSVPPSASLLPRDFVFVVDVSGSMAGFPLVTAKHLVEHLLRDLREQDAFNILLFSGSSLTFSPEPVPATPENIARGLSFLMGNFGGGGTELLPALRTALELPKAPNLARTLVVVTDGFVNVEEEAHALVTRNLGQATLFPFGIGMSVNRDLLERLGRAGRTSAVIIEGPERAVEKAERFRQRINRPLLTGTQLLWKGTGQLSPLPQVAPAYADQPWSFVARYEGAGKPSGVIEFTGVSVDGPFARTLSLGEAAYLPPGPLLAQCWARDRLDEKMDDYGLERDQAATKQAIIDLGLRFNLLTPFTSFVAVDTYVPSTKGPVVPVTQPLLTPAGTSPDAMGQAVPSAPEPGTWALLSVSGLSLAWWKRRQKRSS